MSQTTTRPLSNLESQMLRQVRENPGRTFEDHMPTFAGSAIPWNDPSFVNAGATVDALAYLIANFYVLRNDITGALTAAEWSRHCE
jgi:hypothetical protein